MSTMRLKFAFAPIIGGVWGDEPKSDSNDMVCVRVADFDDQAGKVSTEKLTKRNISPSEQRGRVLQRGDLLLEKSGGGEQTSVGRSVRFDHDFTAVSSNFIALLRPRGGHDANFLTYLMRALYHGGGSIPHIKQTTGIQNLDCDSYLSRAFDFPAATGERRIAGYLDDATGKVDRLVALRRRQMELLREQRAALIQQSVTRGLNPRAPLKDSGLPWLGQIPKHWQVIGLRRLAKYGTSITYGIVQAGPHIEGGIPYIRTSDMSGDSLPLEGYLCTTPEIDASYRRSKVQTGDVVVAIRATIGKVLPVPPELDGANLTQGTAKVSPGPRITTDYLLASLQSKSAQLQFGSLAKGTTFMEITLDMLRKFKIPLPPKDEQEEITNSLKRRLPRFDDLLSAYTRQLELLTEYRAALIHECVTGQRAVPQN
jgi:type I restriction enzyme, S subunit